MARKIFTRFPGSKADYDLGDRATRYDAVIEPFAGSADLTFRLLPRVRYAFLSDADPTVFAGYWCWLRPETHGEVYAAIAGWQEAFRVAAQNGEQRIKQVWDQELRPCLDKVLANGIADHAPDAWARIAATSIVLRYASFGGCARTKSKTPELNIAANYDRVSGALQRLRFRFPPQPKARVFLGRNWQECCQAVAQSDCEAAIALVDPPYYADRKHGRMVPCYPNHKPHDQSTLMLSVNPTRELLSTGKIKRLVLTNYISDRLHQELAALGRDRFTPNKKLNGMNAGSNDLTNQIEGIWEWGYLPPIYEQQALAI